jgi:hypothetical protein
MNMSRPSTFSRLRKKRRIAFALFEGPRALFPPAHIDDYGWLEPDLVLQLRTPNHSRQSLMLFTDNSMNRSASFLPPVLRHVFWDTSKDISPDTIWPSVSHALGHVHHWRKVQHIGRRLQRCLTAAPFAVFGHSSARAVPTLPVDPRSIDFRILSRNGVQSLDFQSPVLANDALSSLVLEAFELLLAEAAPLKADGWRERYDDAPLHPTRTFRDWVIGKPFVHAWGPNPGMQRTRYARR